MGLARVNLALAGVVTLLALATLYGPEPGDTLAEAPLTELDPGKIRQIRIDRRGRDPIAFERDADGWGMTAPYRIAANGDKLQALARIASTPSHRGFPVGQADLAELGLAPASLHLELDGLVLEIGGTEPIQRRRYVRLEGRIHLIDDLFQHHLLAGAEAFVDPHPFPDSINSASLGDKPLTAVALHLLSGIRSFKVENGNAPPEAHRLEVRMEGVPTALRFRLASDGQRLWREHPPLLYRLETPMTPDLLRE